MLLAIKLEALTVATDNRVTMTRLNKANNLLLSMVDFGNKYTHDNSTEQFASKHLLNNDIDAVLF